MVKVIKNKSRKSRELKWVVIYENIIKAIRSGSLKASDRLPSTRDLAGLNSCHRFTVMAALQALVAEGWLEARERSRYFVSERTPVFSSARTVKSNDKNSLEAAIVRPYHHDDLERPRYKLEFLGGQPDLRLFPMDQYRKVMVTALKNVKTSNISYGSIDGLAFMHQQIRDYLRRTRNLTDKEFVVTHGSQEALYLIANIFIKAGDCVAVEAKGYPPAWQLFTNLGAKVIPIRVDEEGLVTDDLAKKIKQNQIKLIYTTPLHQYPTTVTLSPRRRQSLIHLAETHRIPILEDDYDHEFHYSSPPPAPLASETAYAIYACSFSKVLFPGSRLGVIACNEDIKKHLVYQKHLVSRQSNSLSQLAFAHWLREGGFERHLRQMRRTYEMRLSFLIQELELLKNRHDISWQKPSGGISLWLNLNKNSSLAAERAKAQGILFQKEQDLDYLHKEGTHLRIGFACVNEKEIKQGISVLRNVL